jgi:uncharacterized protein (DUF3084 family)
MSDETQQPVATEKESRSIYLPFIQATVGELIEKSQQVIADLQQASTDKDAIIEQRNREIAALQGTIKAKAELVQEHGAKVAELEGQVKSVTDSLGMARMLLKEKTGIPQGIEKLENGGIRFAVTLDVDEASVLLSWADSAGEDPAVYIARQVKDALVMVVSS